MRLLHPRHGKHVNTASDSHHALCCWVGQPLLGSDPCALASPSAARCACWRPGHSRGLVTHYKRCDKRMPQSLTNMDAPLVLSPPDVNLSG